MSSPSTSDGANASLRLASQAERPPSIATGPSSEVLRRLELTVTRRLDGMLQGDYRGLVPGHGSELGETRPYTAGDDVRRIDWNVTARTHRAAHPRDDRRPRARDLGPGRPLGQPRLRHRRLREARPRPRRHRRRRLPHPAHRQPHRRRRARGREGRRPSRPAADATTCRPCCTGPCWPPSRDHPGASDLEGALKRLAAATRRRGLAVVVSDFLGRRRLGAPAAGARRPPRGAGHRGRRPPRARAARRRPARAGRPRDRATSARSRPPTPRPVPATPRPPPQQRDRHRPPHPQRRRRPPRAPHRPRLAARPRPLRRPGAASGSNPSRGSRHDLPGPRTDCWLLAAGRRARRAPTSCCSSARRKLRRALHQPRAARPGRAQAPGLAPPRAGRRRSCWPSAALVVGVRPAGPATRRSPGSGPRSCGHRHLAVDGGHRRRPHPDRGRQGRGQGRSSTSSRPRSTSAWSPFNGNASVQVAAHHRPRRGQDRPSTTCSSASARPSARRSSPASTPSSRSRRDGARRPRPASC